MQTHLPEVEEGCREPEALEVDRAEGDGLHEPKHLGNKTEDEANEQDNQLVAQLHFDRKYNRLGVGIELRRLWWVPGHHFRIASVRAVPEEGHEHAVKEGAKSDDRLDCLASRRAGTSWGRVGRVWGTVELGRASESGYVWGKRRCVQGRASSPTEKPGNPAMITGKMKMVKTSINQ